MIFIDSVSCEINASGYKGLYGFEYKFEDGLNIISGENSSGKSTVLSCIYYCLGMEQLLGGNRRDILDKCLTAQFIFGDKTYNVLNSVAKLRIKNSTDLIADITRKIKSVSGSGKENVISVVVSDLKGEVKLKKELYLHNRNDHFSSDGFFNWLSEFSGIKVPYIEGEDNKIKIILYMQNIFSSSLVEQTKGWSDFYAQMPVFNIRNSKRKVSEYLLGINSIVNEAKIEELNENDKRLKERWKSLVKNFESILSYNNLTLSGINAEFIKSSTTKASVDKGAILYDDSGVLIDLDEYLGKLRKKHDAVLTENKGKSNIIPTKDNKHIFDELKKLNNQLRKIQVDRVSEAEKINNYKNELALISIEVENLEGIKNVGYEINDVGAIERCPLCESSLEIEERSKITSDKIDCDFSIKYLRTQRDLYRKYHCCPAV
jgi:DNA repair exonuclease SbcCD ATPase subunit